MNVHDVPVAVRSNLAVAHDLATGRWLFQAGFRRECCRNDAERAGYDEAATDAESLIDSLFSRRADTP